MNRVIKIFVFAFIALCFVAAPLAGVQAQDTGPTDPAPLTIGTGIIIPNQYIVVLKPTSGPEAQSTAIGALQAAGGQVIFEYGSALKGFAAILPDQALQALRANPQVAYIEADQVVSLGPDLESGPEASAETVESGAIETEAVQTPATWGLDRIDQRGLPLNNTYTYLNNGAGVHVYIIDTGIRSTHSQFTGRATKVFDSVGDGQNGNDCAGHGTHVAGTIGGITYGVAKAAQLHAVRVLNCAGSGSYAGVIAGINWVAAHRIKPAVANMSLGGPSSSAINAAVATAIANGVTFAVAAGNDNQNACNSSPASTPAAITVGSTTSSDARSYFSNWGTCLDIFAPGSNITSAWIGSDTATNTISGTSMATPHTAGVAALYLQAHPTATPATVAAALISLSTKNVVSDPVGSVNRLLYSMVSVPPSVVPTPVAPSGATSDTTPTYAWTKVTGATQYQYQLFKGTTSVYVKLVAAGACGTTTNCVNTPTGTGSVLPYAAYTWRVRAMIGGTWRAFSPAKAFTISIVPTPILPAGTITTPKPVYRFTKILGATQYRYQLFKGATLVYTQTVAAAACGIASYCLHTPTTALTAGAYTWKVQAMLGGIWRAFSPAKAFTLSIASGFNSQFTSDASGWTPLSGAWSVASGFYKSPGIPELSASSRHINNYPTLTYEVKMLRTGCTTCSNYVYFRGNPAPLGSSGSWNNGYRFNIANDNTYCFGYYQNGSWYWIVGWTYTPVLTTGWNTVKITQNGTFNQVFINGTRIGYGNLTAFSNGQVGVGYYRDSVSTGNMLNVDYATLAMTAPASSVSTEGINFDELNWADSTATGDPNMAP